MQDNSDIEGITQFTKRSKTGSTECMWNSVHNMQGGDSRKKDVVRDLVSADMLKLMSSWTYVPLGMLQYHADVLFGCENSIVVCVECPQVTVQVISSLWIMDMQKIKKGCSIIFLLPSSSKRTVSAFHKNLFTKKFSPSVTELIKSRILQSKESAGLLSVWTLTDYPFFITKIKLICTSLLLAAAAGRKMRKQHLKP